jgi:hypothetical protein
MLPSLFSFGIARVLRVYKIWLSELARARSHPACMTQVCFSNPWTLNSKSAKNIYGHDALVHRPIHLCHQFAQLIQG